MKYITYGSLALALFLILNLLLQILFRSRFIVSERLGEIKSISEEEEASLDTSTMTGQIKQNDRAFQMPLFGPYLKSTSIQLTEAHLMIKTSEFMMISLSLSLMLFALLFLITQNLIPALLVAIAGFILPKMYIVSVRDKRKKILNNQLPEFLNILSNALRAGLSFNQAISTAGNEMPDPICWEFQKVLRDNTLGRPMDEALTEMALRTGDEDIEMFVSAINIQRQVGGNLSEVLDMIASTIRDRVKLKGEIRTLTAQNKLSATIIGSLPVVIVLVLTIISPKYISPLIDEPMGQILIALALIMMGTGAFLLKRVTTLEV